MTTRLPRGKSACTKSAKLVDAMRADMQLVVDALRKVQGMYARGEVIEAVIMLDDAFHYLNHPLGLYRMRFKK